MSFTTRQSLQANEDQRQNKNNLKDSGYKEHINTEYELIIYHVKLALAPQ